MDAEQVARNDAIFRDANDRIAEAAETLGEVPRVPFICECADAGCRDVAPMTLDAYRRLRADPTTFVNVDGHQRVAGPHVAVVGRADGYVVVQKLGRAADVATELDARRG